MSGPYAYQLYGLSIASNSELTGLTAASTGTVDVLFEKHTPEELRSFIPRTRAGPKPAYHVEILNDGATYLEVAGACQVLVSPDARHIRWAAINSWPAESLHAYLLATPLSYALVARGLEPLHATAIEVNGEACALLGGCGYGKSTLAAGFVASGFRLLTDDLLVLRRNGKGWEVWPGVPRLKLFRDSRAILRENRSGPKANPYTEKEILAVKGTPGGATLTLRAFYVLPRRQHPRGPVRFRTLGGKAALFAAFRGTFNSQLSDPSRLRQHFEFSQSLAAGVPFRAISYPKTVAALPGVVRAIVEDQVKLGA